MIKILQISSIVIFTSLFCFPFFFSFLPSINTKMILAVLGLMVFPLDYLKGYIPGFGKESFKDFVMGIRSIFF